MSKDDLAKTDNLEIEALSDGELDSVAGGAAGFTEVASCTCCVPTAVTQINPTDTQDRAS